MNRSEPGAAVGAAPAPARPPSRRIRNQLALSMASLVLAVAALAVVGAVVFSAESTEDELDRELHAEIAELTGEPRLSDAAALSSEVRRRSLGADVAGRVYLYAESEQIIAGTSARWPRELEAGEGPQTLTLDEPQRWSLTRVVRMSALALPDGRRLAVGRDITERERLRRRLAWAGAASLGVALLLGVAGGLVVSRGLLGRVESMSRTVLAIVSSGRRERVPVGGRRDEFDLLAEHFNRLLDENEVLVERTRAVTNEIAHDLRTPLSHLRTRIDTGLADPRTDARETDLLLALRGDVDRILDTFNALLHIAQVETGVAREAMGRIDLTRVARDVCELYEPAAEEAGLRLEAELEPGVTVTGDVHLLAQVLTNMIENALKYAGSGDVTVSLRARGEGVELSVRDRGPGIPAADREHVLGRFVRLEASRSQPGAGLGLAFVAAVARLHQARLRLEDAAPGLRVVLELPGAPGEPPSSA